MGTTQPEPAFRIKLPATISWTEMMSGNFISVALFEMFHNEYLVFGESAEWGKYAASDYEEPMDIIVFLPKHESLFKRSFGLTPHDKEELYAWLPNTYKSRVI